MSAHNHTPNFRAVLDAVRVERFNDSYDRHVAAMVAEDERRESLRREQGNLLVRRKFIANERKYAAEPVLITGFGELDCAHIRELLAAEDEPLLTPEQRAAEDYQDFRQLQDKEARHSGDKA